MVKQDFADSRLHCINLRRFPQSMNHQKVFAEVGNFHERALGNRDLQHDYDFQ